MKKAVNLFIAFSLVCGIYAQENTSGLITYENVQKLELKLEGDMAQYADMLPNERKSLQELIFNPEASLYRNIPKEDDEEEAVSHTAGNAMIQIKTYQPDEFVYHDMKSKKNIEQREFMTRQFLITVDTDTAEWKITGNQKSILGHNCMEAELVGAGEKTLAWFAPTIPVSTGPNGFSGLPGLILAIDIDDGKTSYMAQNIDLKEVPSEEIIKPKKGKKVTYKEFSEIKEAKMKEMQSGGGNRVMIYTTE